MMTEAHEPLTTCRPRVSGRSCACRQDEGAASRSSRAAQDHHRPGRDP
jgi:hypothetical protein